MHNLTFITSNPAKAQQLTYHLHHPVQHKALDLVEIQSLDLHEIVTHKVKAAYEIVKTPVLVEDVSLVFNAYKRLPGPLIKWFLQELGNDGLCQLLENHTDRSAIATVSYALYDGKELTLFDGSMVGTVAKKPSPIQTFGWNPIFIPTGFDKPWSEMTAEEQDPISMRRIALEKLQEYLKSKG